MQPTYSLPPEAVSDYQRDGAVVLRGVLSLEQLAWASQPGDAAALHMLTLHASGGVGATHRNRMA